MINTFPVLATSLNRNCYTYNTSSTAWNLNEKKRKKKRCIDRLNVGKKVARNLRSKVILEQRVTCGMNPRVARYAILSQSPSTFRAAYSILVLVRAPIFTFTPRFCTSNNRIEDPLVGSTRPLLVVRFFSKVIRHV